MAMQQISHVFELNIIQLPILFQFAINTDATHWKHVVCKSICTSE